MIDNKFFIDINAVNFLRGPKKYFKKCSDEFDEKIKKEFEGLSAIFILPKLKNFILKNFPDYLQMMIDKENKEKEFDPRNFYFYPCEEKDFEQIYKWKRNNLQILSLGYSIYKISKSDLFRAHNDSVYSTELIKDDTLFSGKIKNHFEALILFESLNIN